MADRETRHLTRARAMRSFWAMARPRTDNLSAGDWARAALEVLARGGIEAVAVEPLARRLKVTKGSFYWHFRSRAELLEAALHEWETSATREVIALMEAVAGPPERLRRPFPEAVPGPPRRHVTRTLLAPAGRPGAKRHQRLVARARALMPSRMSRRIQPLKGLISVQYRAKRR